jgi:glycosyltransferase involved in cell wall biosynthesis
VDGGRNGVLIPVRSARALADAIADLALSARERQAMGEAGREKARKNFDQRHCIDLTLAVYEDLLRRDRVTGAAA